MANLTQLASNSIVSASAKTRPRWFDGRFLSAKDLERDQNYFLSGQAALGKAAGYGVIHGLTVATVSAAAGQPPDAETIVIAAGQGLTPGGQLVMLSTDLTVRISDIADEENLDVQFGLSEAPAAIARTRTGLYVLALRPVQFTANPISSYPASVQGTKTTHDGSVVEATAVSLVPYPIPAANYDATSQNAAVARQVFLENNAGTLSGSLLPVAMVSVERGAVQWLDQWMMRRDSVPEGANLRFGLADLATQQAFLQQYDAQLQQIVNPLVQQTQSTAFPAANYFQALPPAGRFPLGAIDTTKLTQIFFPPQTNITVSLVPADELPALIEDSLSLPPIDLTLAGSAYADLAICLLIPVPRATFTSQSAKPVPLTSAVPQISNVRTPLDLLRFFQPTAQPATAAPVNNWQAAMSGQTYGYYIRRRSVPTYVSFTLSATTITLTVTPVIGAQAFQYTAAVTPSAASGTVQFNDGSTVLGTVNVQAGIATLILPTLAAGSHSLTAVYQGDTNYSSSTSAAVTQTVAT